MQLAQRMRHAATHLIRRGVFPILGLTCLVLVTSAHIGSPDVWVEGNAGPYPVTVNVQVPGVVPGIANVYVRVTGDGIHEVLASGNTFDATGGAPPPEVAKPVNDAPGLYHVPLWMMTPGSSSVTVYVRGAQGEGKLIVPVVVVAHQRLVLNRPLGFALSVVGIILFLGAVSVVGGAARESTLPAGIAPGPQQKRVANRSMGVAVLVLGTLIFGGWTWWNAEDAKFVKTLYKPMTSESRIRVDGTTPYLDVVITDQLWVRRNEIDGFSRRRTALLTPLVPDHGKLMHAFVIRESDMNVLAHIHPSTVDSVTFTTVLPPLPVGQYRILADIVRESGYTETLTSTVTVTPEIAAVTEELYSTQSRPLGLDPDDAWFIGSAATSDTLSLTKGIQLRWNRGAEAIQANLPAPLNFSIVDVDGKPVQLEPYMGMAAHAMIMRDDGSVFVHLHPTGTVSMAAQTTFTLRQPTDTLPGMVARRMQGGGEENHEQHMSNMSHMAMSPPQAASPSTLSQTVDGGNIRFPYAFPKPGQYRVWVQVKVAGEILTGAFIAEVAPGKE